MENNIVRSMQLPPIKLQKYERYLPTAFDESMSILEKINKVINYLQEYGELTEDMIGKWNEVYRWIENEGIDESVLMRVEDLIQDGTISELINEKIFDSLANQIDLDKTNQRLDENIGNTNILKEVETSIENYPLLESDVDDSARINRAITDIGENGTLVFPQSETYTIGSETVLIYCNVKNYGATIIVDGNQSIQVGNSTSNLMGKSIEIPTTIKENKNWLDGEVGLKFINLYSCTIRNPFVRGFEVGVVLTAYDSGNVYNNYYFSHLNDNKINLKLTTEDAGGWTNENNIFANRLSHDSSNGVDVVGTKHIFIEDRPHLINNNVFYKPSVEGSTAEYKIECHGAYNLFINGRYEGSPTRVLFGNSSSSNVIFYGYASFNIVFEDLGRVNHAYTRNKLSISGSSQTGGVLRLGNSSGEGYPSILGFGGSALNNKNPKDYVYSIGGNVAKFKSGTDEFPKVEIDYYTGALKFGDGSKEPITGFRILSDEIFMNNNLLHNGMWDSGHIIMGGLHIWEDDLNNLRVKSGKPISAIDGKKIMLE